MINFFKRIIKYFKVNEISQDGNANIAIQDAENITVNITQQLGKSVEYQSLLKELKNLKDLFQYIPESESDKRFTISEQINELENFIEKFKEDILLRAKEFNRVEINTERLKIARDLFNEGKFKESSKYLQSKSGEIETEQSELLKKREEYEQEIIPKLEQNSMEFLILALSTANDYENPDSFTDACKYFERSIESFEAHYNLFPYAQFLAEHNNYPKAKENWEKCLKYLDQNSLFIERAELLNNIGIAYYFADDYENAKFYYEDALQLGRKIKEQKQTEYSKAFIAYVLNNLGNLLIDNNEIDEAEIKLNESLLIRRELANDKALENLDNLAVALLAIGRVFVCNNEDKRAEDSYKESLQIFESLTEKSPFYSLQQIALVKNNLGELYWKMKLIETSEEYFNQAVEMYVFLLGLNPQFIAPKAAYTFSRVAEFHQSEMVDKEKSIQMAYRAIILSIPMIDTLSSIQNVLTTANEVLLNWGLSVEGIKEGYEKFKMEFMNEFRPTKL